MSSDGVGVVCVVMRVGSMFIAGDKPAENLLLS